LLQIFELIDFTALPAETQPIAQMLTDGYAQTEISTRLGLSEEKVGSLVRQLRESMIDQALAHADRLDARLREHLLLLRSSTASVGGGRTGKRRTA
jgi:DNA-binding transcriptional regulator LsrR (DeoR family)